MAFKNHSLLASSLIAAILIGAAILKWMFPAAKDPYFYFMIGGLEIVIAGALILYHHFWRAWTLLTLLLSVWLGFSFYTTLFGLPCSCLGSAIDLPRGLTLSINGLMLIGAWKMVDKERSHPIKLKRIVWFLILFFFIGFLISSIYYG